MKEQPIMASNPIVNISWISTIGLAVKIASVVPPLTKNNYCIYGRDLGAVEAGGFVVIRPCSANAAQANGAVIPAVRRPFVRSPGSDPA